MTEGVISDLATAIDARRQADERAAQWLHSFAARLREAKPPFGLDYEADELDKIATRLMISIADLTKRAEELLSETQRMVRPDDWNIDD